MAVPATGTMLVFSMFVAMAMAMAGAMRLFWLPLDRRLGCHQCSVVDRFIIDAVADVFLDIHQVVGKILACKADGGTAGACTCRSSNTVHIIFTGLRQIKVKNMADFGDVKSTSCNVCCDQDVEFAVLEFLQ